MEGKFVKDSYTERVQLINLGDLNGSKRLFGGTLLAWIDMSAGITARRHSGKVVTTAAIDNLSFFQPAFAGDLVILCSQITYTGRTSMEVRVRSYVEKLNGELLLINEAYVIMVALDESGHPTEVPPVIPVTDEEKQEFEAGIKRKALRAERKYAK